MQARADDDFGVRQLDLVYSVNGGPEKTVTLYGKGAQGARPRSARGHTIYLEELGVKPGDFVSYYAKAHDTDTVKGPKDDVERHLLRRDPAVQPELPPGAVAGRRRRRRWRRRRRQNQPGALSRAAARRSSRRRSTSSATRRRRPPDKFKEDTVFVQLAQAKLREEVDELSRQMQQRLGAGAGENIARRLRSCCRRPPRR